MSAGVIFTALLGVVVVCIVFDMISNDNRR